MGKLCLYNIDSNNFFVWSVINEWHYQPLHCRDTLLKRKFLLDLRIFLLAHWTVKYMLYSISNIKSVNLTNIGCFAFYIVHNSLKSIGKMDILTF